VAEPCGTGQSRVRQARGRGAQQWGTSGWVGGVQDSGCSGVSVAIREGDLELVAHVRRRAYNLCAGHSGGSSRGLNSGLNSGLSEGGPQV
jgi:hypothetical protein